MPRQNDGKHLHLSAEHADFGEGQTRMQLPVVFVSLLLIDTGQDFFLLVEILRFVLEDVLIAHFFVSRSVLRCLLQRTPRVQFSVVGSENLEAIR